MKFPKQRSAPPWNPRGESQARALDRVDAPYLTARAPGVTVRKQGQFTNIYHAPVEQRAATTYLWGDAVLEDDSFLTASWGPQDRLRQDKTYGAVITDSTYTLPTSFVLYAGDGYVLRLAGRTDDSGYWPLLVRLNLGDEYSPLPANAGGSISFFDTARLEGGEPLGQFARLMSLVVSGHDGAAYRAGFAGAYQYTARTPITATGGPSAGAIAANNIRAEVRGWFMDTATFAATPQTFGSGARQCGPFIVHSAGAGKLAGLQFTTEQLGAATWVFTGPGPTDGYYTGDWLPFRKPQLLRSDDHGNTWASEDADFLMPYIAFDKVTNNDYFGAPWDVSVATVFDRLVANNNTLLNMGRSARFIYTGNDTTLLIVQYCTVSPGTYATLLFRDVGGTGFARLSWPPDAWTYTDVSVSLPRQPALGGYFYNACWSLQEGHAFVPTQHADGVRVLYTLDHGDSWVLSAPVPEKWVPALTYAFFATPVRPGSGVVPSVDEADARIEFARVGPTFDSFTPIGACRAGTVDNPVVDELIGYAGRYFAYVGDGAAYPRKVSPIYAEYNA